MANKVIIGIDLAGKQENPTGWCLWTRKTVETGLLNIDSEILQLITFHNPSLIAVDAPFSFPKRGLLRKADKEMIKKGYRVFPPRLSAMEKLTARAIKLNKVIGKKGYKTIEVHPTSTRKALQMPSKDWRAIQCIFNRLGVKGSLEVRHLAPHELDAITATLTAYLHLENQTEAVGDEKAGYIIIPKNQDWRKLEI